MITPFRNGLSSAVLFVATIVLVAVTTTTTTTLGCPSPNPPSHPPYSSCNNPPVSSSGAGGSTNKGYYGAATNGIPVWERMKQLGNRMRKAKNAAYVLGLMAVRGGQLHEPGTLPEVEELVTSAGINGRLVVLDFTASWCGPCQQIGPVFKQLSEEMDDVVFVKVDVDENPETAAKYNVSAMPTFVLIKGGVTVERVMGANKDKLVSAIKQHKS